MKKTILLLTVIPTLFWADSLKEIISFANTHNNMINAKHLTAKAKQQEAQAVDSSTYPTVDIGGYYQSLNERSTMTPGDISSGYAKISYNIYDGGTKSSNFLNKQSIAQGAKFDIFSFQQSLNLDLIESFYNIKNLDASIAALDEERVALNAQLDRIKKFFDAKLATKDEIDKLQAAYDTNGYDIESLKFQRLSLQQSLELKIGKTIPTLDPSNIEQINDIKMEKSNELKSLEASAQALQYQAKSISSNYMPQVNIEDTYSVYDYGRTDTLHPAGLDDQNKLLVSLNVRLYDNSSINKNKTAILMSKNALDEQIKYMQKQQTMLFDLAKSRIQTSNLKIKSSKSALISATSAYETIEQKYKAGIVDNVAYLDALAKKTSAKALYKSSLNDLEVAYAKYYYYAGKNLQEFIK